MDKSDLPDNLTIEELKALIEEMLKEIRLLKESFKSHVDREYR